MISQKKKIYIKSFFYPTCKIKKRTNRSSADSKISVYVIYVTLVIVAQDHIQRIYMLLSNGVISVSYGWSVLILPITKKKKIYIKSFFYPTFLKQKNKTLFLCLINCFSVVFNHLYINTQRLCYLLLLISFVH